MGGNGEESWRVCAEGEAEGEAALDEDTGWQGAVVATLHPPLSLELRVGQSGGHIGLTGTHVAVANHAT